MPDDNDDLLRIAEEIADRTPVNWQAHVPRNAGDAVRLENLKLVESVAMAYGSVFETTAGDQEPHAMVPHRGASEPALFEWGHLRVLEKLGVGSFGEVFRAYDPLLDREVALKLRHPQKITPAAGEREFIHEARLLARVRHPNVLVVHGADTHDQRVGLWTDLVAGRTLEQWLAEEGPLSAQSVALIGLDLCRALAAVHAAGLVHGDVKASNVMRERGGRIVLMDFGAGVEVADSDAFQSGAGPRGTPLAMAPEVLQGGTPSPASDLYSLGALLYRLASGCHPIEAETLGELLERCRRTHITPLRDSRPDLPPEFVAIVERALARNPADRFPSAGAMEHALLSWIAPVAGHAGDAPVPSPPLSPPAGGVRAGWLSRAGLHAAWRHTWLRVAATLAVLGAAGGVVAFVAGGRHPRAPLSPRQVRSLAVLPFQALDQQTQDNDLGLGIADALINRLSRLPQITVSPTSAVLRYADARPDLQTVGETLGVEGLLEGRIQRSAGRIRVTAQLVSTSGGKPIWAATFDQASANLFELEDSISEQLVRALRLRLTDLEMADLTWRPTTSAEAYQAYLMGRHFWNKWTAASLQRSVEYFEQATGHDPQYARAYAGLGTALSTLPGIELAPAAPDETYPRAIQAAQKALELDPTLAEGHAVLGVIRMHHDWDWPQAEAEFQRALELDPECFAAHQGLAELRSLLGEHEDAIAEIRRALEIDPLSLPANAMAGGIYQRAGRWDEAATQLKRALEIEPAFHLTYSFLAAADEAQGRLDEAVSNWQNAMALSGWPPEDVASFGRAYASGGLPAAWRWRLERLQQSAASGHYVPPALRARAHAALGETRAALLWLERAAQAHDEFLLRTIDEPAFKPLRSYASFAAIRRTLQRSASDP